MKKILLIFLFFVLWAAAKAQDKIITIKQDTIECRIISVGAERISYEQKTSDHQLVGTSIPVSQVLHYLRTGDSDLLSGLGYIKAKRQPPVNRLMFSLQGGMSHSFSDYSDYENYLRSSGNASAVDDYVGKLKNGYHVNASLHYLLTTSFGLGLDYNFFHSAAKGEFISPGYGEANVPFYVKMTINERQYIHFAGPSVLFQQFPDQARKIRITETVSPGIISFREEVRGTQYMPYLSDRDVYYGQPPLYYAPANSVSTSTTFGAKGSLAIDYAITPHLSAGLSGSFMWAEIHEVSSRNSVTEFNDRKLDDAVNIAHIDYGFIVRFNF